MGVGAVKITFSGSKDISRQLDELAGSATAICKYGLYPAAGIIADEIRRSTPVNTGDLRDSLNIRKMQTDSGVVSVDITFEGYDRHGVPNPVKANVLESGRSDQSRAPRPFIKPAISRVRKKAIAALEGAVDEKINEIIKKNGG